jgi:hypothetical protein
MMPIDSQHPIQMYDGRLQLAARDRPHLRAFRPADRFSST